MIPLLAQLLNFALSFFFWLIVGRFLLGLLIGDRPNFFMDLFRRGTDPVYALVGRLTLGRVAPRYLPWLSLLLLGVLRLLLLPLLRAAG